MIIFGTRGVTLSKESGDFHCPACNGSPQAYTRKSVRRFFTLYFIPVIPLDKLGEYVQCHRCNGTFNVQVLEHDPEAERNQARAEFADHVKRVMVLTALVDGDPDSSESEAIQDVYEKLGGGHLDDGALAKEYAQARQAGISIGDYTSRFADQLNEHGKEIVVKAAIRVALADDPLNVQEEQFLDELAAALNMTQAHFKGVLAEMDE